MNNLKYAVVLEKSATGYGAYVPDLPGCVAVAETKTKVLQLIREAIELHVEAMSAEGEHVPEPAASVEYVQVAFAH